MRIVFHLDMDAFFAAIEERYNPQFRGLPIAVGADPKQGKGRGVVSTANYAARKYGIRSALPITRAWRFAEEARKRGEPATIFLSGNYSLYSEVSERIMKILETQADAFEQASPPKFSVGKFEQASVDEAYLDLSWMHSFEEAEELARVIKNEILDAEGLTCSIGIGPNKLVAKIASDFQKPDGLTVVKPERVEEFLSPMSIRAIPGVGPKSEATLNAKGIKTIADLQKISRGELTEWLGTWGEDLYQKARGISESEVSNEWIAKSVGEQETFEVDTIQPLFILERAHELAEFVFKRFISEGFSSFRTVVITVRFGDFTTQTRSHTSRAPFRTASALHGEVLRLLLPFFDQRENPKRKKIRLIGVRVEKLA